jgi:hypothetical protein
MAKAWRRHWRQHPARVFLIEDGGSSRMIPEDSAKAYPAITLRLSTVAPVAILRSPA